MAYKKVTLKPKKKGQKKISFKKGALTAQAKARGKSISELCANPPSKLIAKRCRFKKNVLVGRKKGKK